MIAHPTLLCPRCGTPSPMPVKVDGRRVEFRCSNPMCADHWDMDVPEADRPELVECWAQAQAIADDDGWGRDRALLLARVVELAALTVAA